MHFSFMETLSTNLTCNVSTKDGSSIYVAQIEVNITASFPVGTLQVRSNQASHCICILNFFHVELSPM